MRGLHPALCGWLSQAAAVLEALERLAAAQALQASRGDEPGPRVREALAVTGWVSERMRQELQGRIQGLFGTLSEPEPQVQAALSGEPLLAIAQAVREAWHAALPRVDAHSRLVLRLQLAQWEAVVLPGLVAVCEVPPPAPSLVHALRACLPQPATHPESFLS